jgi:murein DD-endopeptidase MepM/ murein hydrolase activator NlpD
MRIVLAIASVALFAAVAVAASTSGTRAQPSPSPSLTPAPRYTPIPADPASAVPKDVGRRLARADGHLTRRFVFPIEGIAIPDDPAFLPGAPRDYRAGVHEGVDFPADSGTPVFSAAAGTVIRADTSFLDWTRQQQEIALYEALTLGYTPPETLDRIRGRQVWIDHGRGVITRYAHLGAVSELAVGQPVEAGALIGEVGSSGYPQGGPHLHFEVRVNDDYYGDGLDGEDLVLAVWRLFG